MHSVCSLYWCLWEGGHVVVAVHLRLVGEEHKRHPQVQQGLEQTMIE